MPQPTASDLIAAVKAGFRKIEEPIPRDPEVETIARVVAGRLRRSLGTWPFPAGVVNSQTVAFFVGTYVDQRGPDALRHRTLVQSLLPSQFIIRGKAVPERDRRTALERLIVGALLTKTLPPPRAAPLEASRLVVDYYLASFEEG
jgi:hypothetical protein